MDNCLLISVTILMLINDDQWVIVIKRWVRGRPFLRTVCPIWTDPPTHPSICINTIRKYVRLRWDYNRFQLSSSCLEILYLLVENRMNLMTESDQNCCKTNIQTKIWVSRCTYYFSPCNLHSHHFSTHPATPICILCKLEKPYAKMDHP